MDIAPILGSIWCVGLCAILSEDVSFSKTSILPRKHLIPKHFHVYRTVHLPRWKWKESLIHQTYRNSYHRSSWVLATKNSSATICRFWGVAWWAKTVILGIRHSLNSENVLVLPDEIFVAGDGDFASIFLPPSSRFCFVGAELASRVLQGES